MMIEIMAIRIRMVIMAIITERRTMAIEVNRRVAKKRTFLKYLPQGVGSPSPPFRYFFPGLFL